MKQRLVNKEIVEFYKQCPHCKKEVNGRTESQVNYNLNIHIQAKHKEKVENDK